MGDHLFVSHSWSRLYRLSLLRQTLEMTFGVVWLVVDSHFGSIPYFQTNLFNPICPFLAYILKCETWKMKIYVRVNPHGGFVVCNQGYLSIQMNKQVRSVHKLTYMFPKSPSLAKDLCLVITQSISEKKNLVYCIYIHEIICIWSYMQQKYTKVRMVLWVTCLQT